MCAQWLATIGLSMDIVGIILLFRFGAIGGDWIEVPGPPSRIRQRSTRTYLKIV